MKERTDGFLEKLKEDSAEYKDFETTGYSLEEKKYAIRPLQEKRLLLRKSCPFGREILQG